MCVLKWCIHVFLFLCAHLSSWYRWDLWCVLFTSGHLGSFDQLKFLLRSELNLNAPLELVVDWSRLSSLPSTVTMTMIFVVALIAVSLLAPPPLLYQHHRCWSSLSLSLFLSVFPLSSLIIPSNASMCQTMSVCCPLWDVGCWRQRTVTHPIEIKACIECVVTPHVRK